MSLDLKKQFLSEATDLNFFQTVYLLEKLYADRGRIGTGDDLQSEALRFETLNSLGFPSSEIAAIMPPLSFQNQAAKLEAGVDYVGPVNELASLPSLKDLPEIGKGPLRLVATFMGLYGVSSPLPSYFTDPITLKKIEYFELKKFLDIFSHRLYSLFYRSWKKYRHYSQFVPSEPDAYTMRLLALTGQWPRKANKAQPVKTTSEFNLRRIPYARFLGNRVRSAKGLQQLLCGYFGFKQIRIREFELSWVEIPVKGKLGEGMVTLGKSFRLGDQMQDRVSRFTVEIGPLPRQLFNEFLPSTTSPLIEQVRELIDAYLRDPLDYEIKVILDPDVKILPVLGSENARMGMGIWLGEKPLGEISCRL